MTYLLYKLTELTIKALAISVAVAVSAVGFCLALAVISVLVLGMFADALIESIVAGLLALASEHTLRQFRKGFSGRFSAVATRYSSLGHSSLRKPL